MQFHIGLSQICEFHFNVWLKESGIFFIDYISIQWGAWTLG